MAMLQIVLLRGINVGTRNRVPMAQLRELFASAGFADVRTYLQSGNVVLASDAPAEDLARTATALMQRGFGVEVAALVRTAAQLGAVVERDPLGELVSDPRRYQVSFLDRELSTTVLERLQSLTAPGERLVAAGHELYAWHPDGIARSKLWLSLIHI